MKPLVFYIRPFALLAFLLFWGCEKDVVPHAGENEAALNAVAGFYSGKLTWVRYNPLTGESTRGIDPAAQVEVKPTGPDKVTFRLITPVFLANSTFSSKLFSKMESGSGPAYTGQFVFEYGDQDMLNDSSFGYYNQTQINIGQGGTLRMFNFTRPNIIREEALTMEGVKR